MSSSQSQSIPLTFGMSTASSLRRADSCLVDETERKWTDIQATEGKRRALLKRNSDSFFSILFSYEGTFWRIMTRDLLLWITIGVYLTLRLVERFTGGPYLEISSNQIGALGALMTFFLVYFHVQYSTRFDRLFQDSVGAQGRIFDASTIIKATLPFERGIRIVRYLNAANILGYVGLSKVYSYDEFFTPLNEKYTLLSEEEYRRIRQISRNGFSSDPIREVISWCLGDVQAAFKIGHIDAHTAQDLRHQVLRVRGQIADMYDHYDQPMLFIYMHFIVFLTSVYLPLMAVYVSQEVGTNESQHWFNDILGLIALLMQGIFVIGIRYLAQVMRVPYAGELESLPVLSYTEDCCKMSLRIMYSTGYEHPDCSMEQKLSQNRQSLGDFWDVEPGCGRTKGVEGLEDKQSHRTNLEDTEAGFVPNSSKEKNSIYMV